MDRQDKSNRGVTEDRGGMTRAGGPMRIMYYTGPESGRTHEVLTNERTLPPGGRAELYRRRWEGEKGLDEIKHKLGEQKAWGPRRVAKAAQGQLVALTPNLLLSYEARREREHGASNEAEDERRQQRVRQREKIARQAGRELSPLRRRARRATPRSVKFVRGLRQARRERLAQPAAGPRLPALSASL